MSSTMSSGHWCLRALHILCVATLLLVQYVSADSFNDTWDSSNDSSLYGQPAPLAPYFQVYEPIFTPAAASQNCAQLLMEHVFAFSYRHPFVGLYKPPTCNFNRVTMNLTVTSRGKQFDRLGIMFLGDIEVFRTSTAEPTQEGIEWTCE